MLRKLAITKNTLLKSSYLSFKKFFPRSLVFLKRITAAEEAAWEIAWQHAHAKLDAGFNARRGELCAQHGPVIVSAGDARMPARPLATTRLAQAMFRTFRFPCPNSKPNAN